MNKEQVKIIGVYEDGVAACAAASRISTSEGNAFDAFEKSVSREKDLKLIGKVLSSGHLTVIEHAYFTVAFNNVSVFAEQKLIEHRLAAYTVKSRRYVDFTGAGYIVPPDAPEGYCAHMDRLFEIYRQLLELEIPREDARFVLPYCFRSNFIMSVNARELSHITARLTTGSLSVYPELKQLGESLKAQLDEIFPGITAAESRLTRPFRTPDVSRAYGSPRQCRQEVQLISCPDHSFMDGLNLKELVRDERPRELEMLNYIFSVKGISLACLTHFARHRILSLLVPPVESVLDKNEYVLPATVKANPTALSLYLSAFESTADIPDSLRPYYALAGNTTDITLGMNARELIHFLRLRTCERAQWEIRAAAKEMLCLLTEDYPELFRYYGPSCAVLGRCTEGRLSCGRPAARTE